MEGSQRIERLWLAVVGILYLLAAWRTPGYFHPDEHYQTLEFAHAALGGIPFDRLPWEMEARIRPWLQPYLYAAVGSVVGIDRPFDFALACRLLTAVISWLSVLMLGRRYRDWFSEPSTLRLAWIATAIAYFLPVLRVRTSSEALSSALMMMAVALIARPIADQSSRSGLKSDVIGGLLLGLAVSARYQVGLMAAGLVLWLVVVCRSTKRTLLVTATSLLGVAFCLGLDRLGYGEWQLTPWRYVSVNVLEGKASTFGVWPWHSYIGFIWHDLAFPFGLLAVLALPIAAWRMPRHVLVWICVPFVVGHSFIGHKEFRFMIPYLVFVPALAVMAFVPWLDRLRPRARKWILISLLVPNLWWLVVDRHPTLRGGPWLQVWADNMNIGPLYHGAENPFGEQPLYTWLYVGDERSESRTDEEVGNAIDRGERFLYYQYQRRSVVEPSIADRRCRELIIYPWPWRVFPRAWLSSSFGRRMFWTRDRHVLFACPK